MGYAMVCPRLGRGVGGEGVPKAHYKGLKAVVTRRFAALPLPGQFVGGVGHGVGVYVWGMRWYAPG